MNPSRYTLIDERFPHPVKRRSRGPKDGKRGEPAITLLPPDPYLIMERPGFLRSSSPIVYRTAPPKSAKNKEASSFVILGEPMRTPVQSRPGSPSGRVSPFRGHGFKSPSTTRPNSRAPSPSDSPKKIRPPPGKSPKPRVAGDVGLPPKSPVKFKAQNLKTKPSGEQTAALPQPEAAAKTPSEDTKPPLEEDEPQADVDGGTAPSTDVTEQPKAKETTSESPKSSRPRQAPPQSLVKKERLTPAAPGKSPVSPTPKAKIKTEAKEVGSSQQSAVKKTSRPPIPPKKIGLKTTLRTKGTINDQTKRSAREESRGKLSSKEQEEKVKEEKEADEEEKIVTTGKKNSKSYKEKDEKENSKQVEAVGSKEVEKRKVEEPKVEERAGGRKVEESKKPEEEAPEKDGGGKKKTEKLVPCFQPDKCQIAPPTMASPSPITTPTISTPSTTPALSASPMKNSQSIAAAPTTVTPSSLSSVSSTVVLTGNLARKEIDARHRAKPPDANEPKDPSPPEGVPAQMVKAATNDSIKWTNRDSLSGEITSTTKVIKAEPEMEVLSPNNLLDSPPRMPPPNVAWDEGRLANGDVPSRAEAEGKLRRFVSAVWRFLGYVFCCRCVNSLKRCRGSGQDGVSKSSVFSRHNFCKWKSFWNPFKCCVGCCGSKCEGKKCCIGRNPKPGNPKPKSRKCCAKWSCSCKECCGGIKTRCLNVRSKMNSICRSLFCLNTMCCQKFLRKFKFCHKLKCCQKNGFCSCCNPNVKRETKRLNKKGSRASNNSKGKENLDVVLVEHTSLMKAAIPVLPSCLAVFCLILNLFLPGIGTFISGILCLCFGKPRFSVKDTPKNRVGSFVVNTIIGVAQLFTVIFCLVGWGWSVWWGVIMYKLSRRQKRLKLAEKNQKEAEGSNVNHNHVDVEQG